MDKTTTGEDNLYYELESPKKESQAGIYDDVEGVESPTHATKPISYEEDTRGAKKKNKRSIRNASQSDTVLIRRLVFISTAVVAVAFLTAAATLILALSLMMSRNGNTGSKGDPKGCGAIYESLTNLAAEVKQIKDNISYVQFLTSNKMDQNTTHLWFAIQEGVNASLTEKLIDVQQQIMELDQKVTNASKAPLPEGPPGYNGTQGPPGPPGPPGSGNLTLCSYVKGSSAGKTPDTYTTAVVEKTELNGKKFLGVNCDSNDAKFATLSSSISGGKRKYTCTCKGTLSSGDFQMYCYIYYWECPT